MPCLIIIADSFFRSSLHTVLCMCRCFDIRSKTAQCSLLQDRPGVLEIIIIIIIIIIIQTRSARPRLHITPHLARCDWTSDLLHSFIHSFTPVRSSLAQERTKESFPVQSRPPILTISTVRKKSCLGSADLFRTRLRDTTNL